MRQCASGSKFFTLHFSLHEVTSKPQAGIAPISDGATSDAIGFAEPAHVDSIDLERDSAIRVQALMALAAYSVLHSSCKHGSALA